MKLIKANQSKYYLIYDNGLVELLTTYILNKFKQNAYKRDQIMSNFFDHKPFAMDLTQSILDAMLVDHDYLNFYLSKHKDESKVLSDDERTNFFNNMPNHTMIKLMLVGKNGQLFFHKDRLVYSTTDEAFHFNKNDNDSCCIHTYKRRIGKLGSGCYSVKKLNEMLAHVLSENHVTNKKRGWGIPGKTWLNVAWV